MTQLRSTAESILRYPTAVEKRTLPHSRSRDVKRARANQLIAASLKALVWAWHTLRRRDDAAESLRKATAGAAGWRASRRRGVLPARLPSVRLGRIKIVSMAVRTFLREARTRFFCVLSNNQQRKELLSRMPLQTAR